MGVISELSNNLKQTFQAGVDALYNKCRDCGATPGSKTPTAISNAIGTIHTNRYNDGYSAGNAAGYNSGRTQGQNDVKGAPNSYGLYTGDQYNANYNAGVVNGKNSTTVTLTITKDGAKWTMSIGYGDTRERYDANADMRLSNVRWS